jgi:hypothetical protein
MAILSGREKPLANDGRAGMRRRGEQKAAVSDSGYSQIAGDTPATTGVQLMRSEAAYDRQKGNCY